MADHYNIPDDMREELGELRLLYTVRHARALLGGRLWLIDADGVTGFGRAVAGDNRD